MKNETLHSRRVRTGGFEQEAQLGNHSLHSRRVAQIRNGFDGRWCTHSRGGVANVCRDGVLTVTVEKLPPPEPKKPKTIEVKDYILGRVVSKRHFGTGGKEARVETERIGAASFFLTGANGAIAAGGHLFTRRPFEPSE
ncbi:hypothetical protein KSP40_PGU018880 [Platanthera guangdongensis]|uniref:SHSP domain-containing protein n=1 Tax=Platanthera guangdongensis TaxID=2320717 RepID=A0ABR2M4M1_9ASPA